MTKLVLIVEDEPSIAENIVYALSTEGFSPKWVSTARDALEVVQSEKVSLIILDVGLPDENGFELAKTIRKEQQTPIIFVTARGEEVDRIVGLEIGADDYVVKPFSPRELSARVKAVLRRSEQAQAHNAVDKTFAVGHFFVDEERYRISYRDQALDLSRYEYRILLILARSPGRVYTRAQLMDLAWEEPDMSLERTVDTHVKTLRQKIKSAGAQSDYILTHRGIGYSLKEQD
jgi:two-component system catabolic regulation response regulator CreB